MAKVDGSKKGGAFERKVAKQLSSWLSYGESEDLLWRSQGSGSRSTGRKKKGQQLLDSQCGDIAAAEPEGHILTDLFSIECKHYKDALVHNLIFAKSDKGIIEFWHQAKEDAYTHDKLPMLICLQNRRPILLGLDSQGTFICTKGQASPLYTAYIHREDLYLYDYETFLEKVDPIVLKRNKTCLKES